MLHKNLAPLVFQSNTFLTFFLLLVFSFVKSDTKAYITNLSKVYYLYQIGYPLEYRR